MHSLLNEIKEICLKYDLKSLQPLIASVENLSAEKCIDIAVFGQFKAGKSSFINDIIGKTAVPTGVIPVTSVITKILYGPSECTYIDFEDGHTEEIKLSEIVDFVSETRNPNNIKKVESARIVLPEMKKFRGLSLVDTPGIGSIFLNNTRAANENVPVTTIAVVRVSAERPLSESDLTLIQEAVRILI